MSHALEVLGLPNKALDDDTRSRFVDYLQQAHEPVVEGGFRGSPHLMSHIASSYAAIMAVVNVGTEEAFDIVDVDAFRKYLLSVKNNGSENKENYYAYKKENEWGDDDDPSKYVGTIPGSMAIHINGEMDIRGVYCSLVCADILGILEGNEELTRGVGEFLLSCQSYEGGFSYGPFGEAHAGYTFCALASFCLISQYGDKSCEKINFNRLMEWLMNRQQDGLGGFNGRINKLIDSCYSFWVGASFELADLLSQKYAGGRPLTQDNEYLFNQEALQGYLVLCC